MPASEIVLARDCKATQIPSGSVEVLAAGTRVRLVQSLGGSYTVATEEGFMLRVDASDADALGLAPQAPAVEPPPGQFSEKLVWDLMRTVYDPEIPVNIVDLGLVYTCQITPVEGGHKIEVSMTMTAPGCGMGDVLKADVERKLSQLPEVKEVQAQIVFDPPWHPGRMTEAAKLQLGLDLDSGSSFPTYGS
jgi:probable FeS assembly SUF system protein SufT